MEESGNIQSNVTDIKSPEKVEVSVTDLQVVVNIIEVSTQRGAFRAPELKGIGEFFEKISGLIPKEKSS